MQIQFINKLLKPEAKQCKSDLQVSPRNVPLSDLMYSVPSHHCTAGEMLVTRGNILVAISPKKPKTQAEKKNTSKKQLKRPRKSNTFIFRDRRLFKQREPCERKDVQVPYPQRTTGGKDS